MADEKRRRKPEGTKPLYVDIPEGLRVRLDKRLAVSGQKVNKAVEFALVAWLDKEERKR